jgi:hypothetical protein
MLISQAPLDGTNLLAAVKSNNPGAHQYQGGKLAQNETVSTQVKAVNIICLHSGGHG